MYSPVASSSGSGDADSWLLLCWNLLLGPSLEEEEEPYEEEEEDVFDPSPLPPPLPLLLLPEEAKLAICSSKSEKGRG